MPKYLVKARYSAEGLAGLTAEGGSGGSSRRAEVRNAVAALGGTIEAFYYAFGETHLFVIAEFADNQAAATLSLTASSTGWVAVTAVPLLTVEDVDAISAAALDYRPPGSDGPGQIHASGPG